MAATPVLASRRVPDHRFYYACAMAFAAIVFLGFSRTYYLKHWFEKEPLSLLLHIHGVIMTLWYALFIVQVTLISRRRVAMHRTLGWAGLFLAGLVLVVDTIVSFGLAKKRLDYNPNSHGAPFLLGMQLFPVLLMFAVLISLAVYWRRRSDYHKRLMTLAMLTVLSPAITRLPFIPQHEVGIAIAISVGTIVVTIVVDTVIHRRLHPAFGWGGAAVIGSMFAFFPIAQSAAWANAVRWMLL